jgi:hypothetical protein
LGQHPVADLADGVTVVPFHPKHAQWVKDRVKLLAMATNQHFAVSDSHALLAQHVVKHFSATWLDQCIAIAKHALMQMWTHTLLTLLMSKESCVV